MSCHRSRAPLRGCGAGGPAEDRRITNSHLLGHGPRAVPYQLLLACLLLPACGQPAAQPPARGPAGKRVDATTAGAIGGRVVFHGAVPTNARLQTTSDAFCVSANPGHSVVDEAAVVGPDGGLQNVFVYVRDGLSAYAFDTPAQPVRIEQQGCRFSPHVTGLQVAQRLELVNRDTTLHNVHAVARANDEFNIGLVEHQSITRAFAAPEVMVTLRCDVHSWMKAYAGVVAHPYFAVTAADGRFDLKGLPPGEYVIEAWHETFGRRTERVSLRPNERREIAFTFGAT